MSRQPWLGETWRSLLSGYEGTVTATVQYLTGCDQIGLTQTGLDKDGKPWGTQFFDVPFCEFVAEAEPKILAARKAVIGTADAPRTGGPRDPIPERQTP